MRLSILIPAREERIYDIDLLHETITNVLANTSDQTEIIAVLDGYDAPRIQSPRVTYIHHSKSIGQRAATNEAARIATGDIVMKLDGHCALSPNFDEALLAYFPENWCVVPSQFNLLVYTWKCKKCGWVKDQSPKPERCQKCRSKYVKQIKHWVPRDGREGSDVDRPSGRRNTLLRGWRFDTNLEYSQFGALYERQKDQPYPETMSLLGACWAMHKSLYLEIEPCDERMGSWGQMGTEISCKVWLSGNEIRVNPNCWFAHFFRVGGLGFPYQGGGQKERAMSRCRELWLKNTWPKQVYPLSWLINHFSPLPDWDTAGNPVRALVDQAGVSFSSVVSGAGLTSAGSFSRVTRREKVTSDTVGSSGLLSTGADTSQHVDLVSSQPEMQGATASAIIAEMIENQGVTVASGRQGANQPCPDDSMKSNFRAVKTDAPVPIVVSITDPVPAAIAPEIDSGKDAGNLRSGQVVNDEVVLGSHDSASSAELRSESESRQQRGSDSPIVARKCALYYSCLSHDPTLELAARNNLKQSTNGHELGVVTLNERIDFGDWQVVVQREKSGTTMHYQILEGLRRSTADYVFLCESDVFYHPSHFDFLPPRDDTFYYNTNVWRVRYQDGHAVRTKDLQQVSGICASRKLLLEHFLKRIEWIESNGGYFNTKQMAYEPGTRGDKWGCKVANWQSEFPNIDITGHGQTLTTPHFSVDSFRNKRYAEGWQETDEQIAGWPLLAGRVQEFLTKLANG